MLGDLFKIVCFQMICSYQPCWQEYASFASHWWTNVGEIGGAKGGQWLCANTEMEKESQKRKNVASCFGS
jgi:hypothetical protein